MHSIVKLGASYGIACFAIIVLIGIGIRIFQAKRWVEVRGRLVRFETEERSNSVTSAIGVKGFVISNALYRYEWEGRHYEGSNCHVLGFKPWGGESSHQFVKKYQTFRLSKILFQYILIQKSQSDPLWTEAFQRVLCLFSPL